MLVGSRSLSCQSALGCFISSCVTLFSVGVGRGQFDVFWDGSRMWLKCTGGVDGSQPRFDNMQEPDGRLPEG